MVSDLDVQNGDGDFDSDNKNDHFAFFRFTSVHILQAEARALQQQTSAGRNSSLLCLELVSRLDDEIATATSARTISALSCLKLVSSDRKLD